jgi:hypothetical protein
VGHLDHVGVVGVQSYTHWRMQGIWIEGSYSSGVRSSL